MTQGQKRSSPRGRIAGGRIAFLVASAILPVFMIGFLLAVSNFRSLMLREKPTSVSLPSPLPPHELLTGKGRLKAAIFVGNEGTELVDLLGPFAVLAESGAFDVFTVAPRREPSPLGSTLSILPDYGFDTAPDADLLVIPPNFDGASPEIMNWIKKESSRARVVLAVCEGARLAAQAGLLDGARATSHFMALPQLRGAFPQVEWIGDGPRVVAPTMLGGEKKHYPVLMTTAGVTASLDGALRAVELFTGKDSIASRLARSLIAPHPDTRETAPFQSRESLPFFYRAAFDWTRPIRAVWIGPGASELEIAYELDLWPRTFSRHLTTLGESRAPFQTRRGLSLIPLEESGSAGPAHSILIPSGTRNADAARVWASKFGAAVISRTGNEAGAIDRALSEIRETEGSSLAQSISRLVEWPAPSSELTREEDAIKRRSVVSFRLIWPPLLIMVLGVLAGLWLRKRFGRSA